MAGTFKISREISFSGTGIHSGEPCKVIVRPCCVPGIFFDLPGGFFPVGAAECDGTARGTRLLFPGGSVVMTVEHLLGALTGLGVWSAAIVVEGPEIPAMDGGAGIFAESIANAAEPGFDMDPVRITTPLALGDPSKGGFIAAIPSDAFEITCAIRYDAESIGCQVFEGVITREMFLRDIAPARTYVLASEIRGILDRGLGRGGNIGNVLVVEDEGPSGSSGLHLPDEPVRHKTLDLIGDLATLGSPLLGRIVAYRAGHYLHLELARRIRRSLAPVRAGKES